MSFQAYLDNIEDKTGLTRGSSSTWPAKRASTPPPRPARSWPGCKEDHDLGRGHGMALVHVITKGADIGTKHVGTTGTHRDESDTLWLDGKATKP